MTREQSHDDSVEISVDGVNNIIVGVRDGESINDSEKKIESRAQLGKENENENLFSLNHNVHAYQCKGECDVLPEHPSRWPQRPLMIRPTPHSFTKVLGIRRARRDDYEDIMGFSAGSILPINNGREDEGESLVVDFESIHFVGTLLLRIKQAPSVARRGDEKSYNKDHENKIGLDDTNSQRDYFANKKRKFQAVIKGRFMKPLSMSGCVTGQAFDRPAGKLPAQWIVKCFIKFISILAPQLDASLDEEKPRFLTPLVATANTVLSENGEYESSCDNSTDRNSRKRFASLKHGDRHLNIDTSSDLEEPHSLEPSSVLSALSANTDLGITVPDTTSCGATGRSLTRKKIFNALSAKRSPEPRFDTHKVYTFEFYQHLLDFGDELAVDTGRIGGMIPLAQATDGQPLKIMAAYKSSENKQELEPLWSFDIFHESLHSYATRVCTGKT